MMMLRRTGSIWLTSLYKIQLRKEKMNKFFIENPYLEGQLDLNADDEDKNSKRPKAFAEDDAPGGVGMLGNSMKYWESISKEVGFE
jgi:hypothetical protein